MAKALIKEWFEDKLAADLNLPRLYSLDIYCGIKETEKAVYALFYTGYAASGRTANHRAHWIPKSAIDNIESLRFFEDYDTAVSMFDSDYAM